MIKCQQTFDSSQDFGLFHLALNASAVLQVNRQFLSKLADLIRGPSFRGTHLPQYRQQKNESPIHASRYFGLTIEARNSSWNLTRSNIESH